jgi:type II secretory pathway pseudopilin PulG
MAAYPRSRTTNRAFAGAPARFSAGFSIVELLVVIAIIIALLGALLAALSLAGRRAQAANTQQFMTTISQGLTQFQGDIGYLPPVLGKAPWTAGASTIANARDYMGQPAWVLNSSGQPSQQSINELQQWFSFTTLPEYLLGYGDRTQDGHGAFGTAPAGSQGSKEQLLGIRSPGDDGYWNGIFNPRAGAPGTLAARNPLNTTAAYSPASANNAAIQGAVFGPYLQLTDSTTLGSISGFDAAGDPIIVFPGDQGYNPTQPKVFVDYWGAPITYYRKAFVSADLKTYERFSSNQTPRDLGDIFALRPAEYRPGEDLVGVADGLGDNTTLGRLKSANYAILSRGPDKAWERLVRRDENGFNRDNIVEAGQ